MPLVSENDVVALHAHAVHSEHRLVDLVDHLKGDLQANLVGLVDLHLAQLFAHVFRNASVSNLVLSSDVAGVSDLSCTAHLRWHDRVGCAGVDDQSDLLPAAVVDRTQHSATNCARATHLPIPCETVHVARRLQVHLASRRLSQTMSG